MEIKQKSALEDYMSLPEGYPAELIGGEIIVSPSPSAKHQKIAGDLFFKMRLFKETKKIPGEIFYEIDVRLSNEDVVRPDIVYVSDESKIGEWIEGAPDLVVEILSPTSAMRDLVDKKDLYERSGVKEYWVVDPENEEMIVFYNEGGRFEVSCRGKECESRVLKGFRWGFEG